MSIDNKTQNIDSWCQIVLDLLDLTFAELFYGFYKEHLETQTPVDYHNYQAISIYLNGNSNHFLFLELFSVISSMRGEINGQLVKLDNWLSLWNIQDISRIYPSQGTQAMLTQETKKVWTLQPKPSHARGAECKEQLEEQHRQGAAVQPYPVIT